MIHLPGVLAAAGEIQKFCQAQGWRFGFIGGVAVNRWGEPRLTQDVDLSLISGFGGEERFVDTLLKKLNVGGYGEVPAELLRWTKGHVNGVVEDLPGLVTRRKREAALWAA